MPSDSNNDILIPKVLILPIMTTYPDKAAIGTMIISGAKLHVATSEGVFELVSSA